VIFIGPRLAFTVRSAGNTLNVVLETYSINRIPPDIGRTVDNLMFFFRNDMGLNGMTPGCISGVCGETSVRFAPVEIAHVAGFLPPGRKLQVGTYWTFLHQTEEGTPRYDYDLVHLALSLPSVGGVTAYSITKPDGVICDESNSLQGKFCALARVFSEAPARRSEAGSRR
jgi:hypothetical protein